MKSSFSLQTALALFAALALPSVAQAQAVRTWVSGVGDDANPCSRTAPCKSFAGAYSKTAVAGDIDALDPGGFGALTITHSISITGAGVFASILASGTNAVTINAPGATVSLRGIDFDGAGAGLNGISVTNAANVHVEDCTFHGFSQAAILLNSASDSRVDVRHASIFGNAVGVNSTGTTGHAIVFIEDSSLDSNLSGNALVNGANATLTLSNTTIVGANPGIAATDGAMVHSFGNNRINRGTPTTTMPLQ